MSKRALIPPESRTVADALNMSPAILSHDFVFVTGVTGSSPDGDMPFDPTDQFQAIFDKISAVLNEADLALDSVVEMTSYHVGLREHFDLFDKVRLASFNPPYPAWTAVEVAGLRREGAVVEVRIIAHTGTQQMTDIE